MTSQARQAYLDQFYRDGTEAEMRECARRGITLPYLRAEKADDQRRVTRIVPTEPIVLSEPITLTFPFDMLVPDNAKYGVSGGRMLLTKRYRQAKLAIQERAAIQYTGPVITTPVSLTARVWFPTAIGDAPNFSKILHDSLQKVIYADDNLVYEAHWIRAGISVTLPVIVRIEPLRAIGVTVDL